MQDTLLDTVPKTSKRIKESQDLTKKRQDSLVESHTAYRDLNQAEFNVALKLDEMGLRRPTNDGPKLPPKIFNRDSLIGQHILQYPNLGKYFDVEV